MGILLNNQQPYTLATLTLPFAVQMPNASPGWKLWIDNESSYAFTFRMDSGSPQLCPSNYAMTIPIESAAPTFFFLAIFGSGAAQTSSNVFLYLIAPNEPDIAESAKYPISRYPPSPNYGFVSRVPNGGVVGTSMKVKTVSNFIVAQGMQLDSLDFNTVAFYEDWLWPNGSNLYTLNIGTNVSACGINYGYGSQPSGGTNYIAQSFRNSGGTRQAASCTGGGTGTTTNMTPWFPNFPYPVGISGIEFLVYCFNSLTTTVGTNVDSYVCFYLNPMVAIYVHVSGPTFTTTTGDIKCVRLDTSATQTGTFTMANAGPGTNAAGSSRVAVKCIYDSGTATYDIYVAQSSNTTFAFPTKSAYQSVLTLSNATFAPVLYANLEPGFGAQVVVGSGTTVTANTGLDLGINTPRATNGLLGPCVQMNIP